MHMISDEGVTQNIFTFKRNSACNNPPEDLMIEQDLPLLRSKNKSHLETMYLVPKDEYAIFYNNKVGSENGGNRGSLIDAPTTTSDSMKNQKRLLTNTPQMTETSMASDAWTAVNIGTNVFASLNRPSPISTVKKTSMMIVNANSPLTPSKQ